MNYIIQLQMQRTKIRSYVPEKLKSLASFFILAMFFFHLVSLSPLKSYNR